MKQSAGMGLIEVVVGLGLMALCILGLNSLVVTMIRGNLSAELNDQATRLAEAKIDEVQNAGYAKVPVGTTTDTWWSASGGTGIMFQRKTTVAPGALPTTRTITVTMTWIDQGRRQTTFQTEIAQ